MKCTLIALLVFLSFAATSDAAYWSAGGCTVSVSKSTDAPYNNWSWVGKLLAANGTTVLQTIPFGSPKTASFSFTCPTFTYSEPFFIVFFASSTVGDMSAYLDGTAIRGAWVSSYPGTTGAGTSLTGPYLSQTPVNGSGAAVNPYTGVAADPTNYEKETTIVNSTNTTNIYEVSMVSSIGQVYGKKYITLAGNTSQLLLFSYSQPFNIVVYQMQGTSSFDSDGNPTGQTLTRATTSPLSTTAATPSANPPAATPTITDGSRNNASSPSATAANEQAQVLAAGDQMTAATKDNTNQLSSRLDAINATNGGIATAVAGTTAGVAGVKTSVDALGTKLDSLNSTSTATGNNVADIKSALTSGQGDSGSGAGEGVTENGGATGYATGLSGRYTSLQTSLVGLVDAAGLGGGIGTSPLTWEFTWQGVSHDLTLETYADSIEAARSVELWVMGIFFLYAIYGIARGTFAEETKQ